MKNCEKFQEMMSLYIDTQLNKQEQDELFEHLNQCQECKEEFAMLQSMIKMLNKTEFLPLPEGYHEELMDKISQEKVKKVDFKKDKKGGRWKKYTAIAAAFLVVAVIGIGVAQPFSKGYDLYNTNTEIEEATMDIALESKAMGVTMNAPMDTPMDTPMAADTEVYGMDEIAYEGEMGTAYSTELSVTNKEAEVEVESERKKIKTAYLNIEVDSFDEFMNSVETFITKDEGYIESYDSYIYYEDESSKVSLKAGYLRARVDGEIYASTLEYIKGLGKVENENEYIEDVTSSYVDVKARMEVKEAEEDRLLVLLEQAESLEDIITIEARLSEVRGYIESYEAQLKAWDKQVDFSTIEINIREKQPSSLSSINASFGDKIKDSFIQSVNIVINGSQNLVIGLIVISIPLIIILAVVIVIVVAVRKIRRNKGKLK